MTMKRLRYLHRPIKHQINGHIVELLTVGHCARALNRSVATITWWEQRNMFPRAPYLLSTKEPSGRRRLYPAAFVTSLHDMDLSYIGTRLDRQHFQRFHDQVFEAFAESMACLRAHEGC